MKMEQQLEMPLHRLLFLQQQYLTRSNTYMGIPAIKHPIDFWVYRQIIHATKPDIIVEIGTRYGGTTLALAHILDIMQRGNVVSIDIDQSYVGQEVRQHPRIKLIQQKAAYAIDEVKEFAANSCHVMVIEDSAHTKAHTLEVLRTYSPLCRTGDYFVVEDTICHHGLSVGPNPGPYEAVEEFLQEDQTFVQDRAREPFLVTWNPGGYLRKR